MNVTVILITGTFEIDSKNFEKWVDELEIRQRIETLQRSTFEISLNTQKSRKNLRRLVVIRTSVKNNTLEQVWKTHEEFNNNNNNNNNNNSWPFLKWIREDLKQMDKRTRKLMTMHKALYLRDDVDWLYMSRKEGERWLTSIEDSVDASIQRLEDYIEKRGRRLIKDWLQPPETILTTRRPTERQ